MKLHTIAALCASVFALAACQQPQTSAPKQPAPENTAPASDTAATASSSPAPAAASAEAEVAAADLPVIEGVTTSAPEAPPPVNRNHAARVKVKFEVQEKVMRMADGVEYKFWTFGGHVPGPMIRVREGDTVELEFANRSDSTVPHNIDFHAATGPVGGAEA